MNSTTWTSVLGIIQAVGVSVVDFFAHTSLEGGALKQPTFWVGLVIAAAMGVKGFLTQGIPPAGMQVAPPVAAPVDAPKV